jgi:hypothetical protein
MLKMGALEEGDFLWVEVGELRLPGWEAKTGNGAVAGNSRGREADFSTAQLTMRL